uniref:Uncharacterized protein n=1 Tax=Arundo donax TaxID=35708 RepID=A0A0A9CZF2_ARUDO
MVKHICLMIKAMVLLPLGWLQTSPAIFLLVMIDQPIHSMSHVFWVHCQLRQTDNNLTQKGHLSMEALSQTLMPDSMT